MKYRHATFIFVSIFLMGNAYVCPDSDVLFSVVDFFAGVIAERKIPVFAVAADNLARVFLRAHSAISILAVAGFASSPRYARPVRHRSFIVWSAGRVGAIRNSPAVADFIGAGEARIR